MFHGLPIVFDDLDDDRERVTILPDLDRVASPELRAFWLRLLSYLIHMRRLDG